MAADELKRWVKEEGDEHAIHGGNVVTAKMVDRLGDGAVVRCARQLLGGGKGKKKKKMAKRATEDEQGVKDASSSEANVEAASGLVKK